MISSYFKGINIMTPEIIKYGALSEDRYYELSKGTGLDNEPIFGVTVVRKIDGIPPQKCRDESQMFHYLAEAQHHIKELGGKI